MQRVPISLNIDDPAPIVSVYYDHIESHMTADGRPLAKTIPNAFLDRFCDVIEINGIRGKFSVVPQPAGRGDITKGIPGYPDSLLTEWLDTVRIRVAPRFSVCPEMLTHHMAVNLATGEILPLDEMDWAATQDRTGLTPYISYALSLLRQVGFSPVGVTSPWAFGIQVEEEYVAAISQAVHDTCGTENAWYFLRSLRNKPNAKPWVALNENGRTVVSIPSTLGEHFWQTIDDPDDSEAHLLAIADKFLTADGADGEILRVLDTGGWPILCCHWQSLFSNGTEAGLRILNIVAQRVNRHLSHRVQWMSFEEIMGLVLSDKESFPKPQF